MIKATGAALAFALAAVTAFDEGGTTCSKTKTVAAKAECSEQQNIGPSAKVVLARLTRELDLSPEQVVETKAAFAHCQAHCAVFVAEFASLTKEIQALESSTTRDDDAIMAKKAALDGLKLKYSRQLDGHRTRLIANIRAILTPAQAGKFDRIQSDVFGDDTTALAAIL